MPWNKDNMPLATKNKDWTKKQKKAFASSANAALREYNDEGKAIATGISVADSLANSIQEATAEFMKVPFIEPGIVRYGDKVFYVKKETLDKIMPGLRGKPITIEHPNGGRADAEQTHGYVHGVLYNSDDGQYYADFLLHTKEGKEASRKLKFGSVVYDPIFSGKKGVHNGQPYDDEIIGGDPISFGLVAKPRYENARLLKNSIKENDMTVEDKTMLEKLSGMIEELKNAIIPAKTLVNSEPAKDEEIEKEEARKKVKEALKNSKGEKDEEFLKNCSRLEKKMYNKKLKKMNKGKVLSASLENSTSDQDKEKFSLLNNAQYTIQKDGAYNSYRTEHQAYEQAQKDGI